MKLPARPLKAVVFDLDGLMFNTEDLYNEVGAELLRRRGKQYSKELKDAMMGRPGFVALQIMIDWHELADTVQILQQETDDIFAEILPEKLTLMPGLLELLALLEEKQLPKAIATSSGKVFATSTLSRFDLLRRFQFVLTAENVTEGKPSPEIYLTAAKQLGIDPAEMMVLEDSANGCRAAVTAGAFTVAVPGVDSRHHDFSEVSLIAESLADPRIRAALYR